MTLRALVIADDLTGACDAGVSFAPAYVALREPWPPNAEALIVSTASRGDTPEAAAEKVRAMAARLPGATVVFKKIDSVLRGNVRAEIEAMGVEGAVVCPAFPEQGRIVRDGVALPAGVDLRALLEDLPVVVADAETPADLQRIAEERASLYVGSAGLARALGRRPEPVRALGLGAVPVLLIGSTHAVTLDQLSTLQASGCAYELHTIDMAAPTLTLDPMPRALLLCGGDTAGWVLEQLKADGIWLEGEVEPGVPFGRIAGGLANGAAVVTKSGGFGSPDTLVNVVKVLSS